MIDTDASEATKMSDGTTSATTQTIPAVTPSQDVRYIPQAPTGHVIVITPHPPSAR